MSVLVSLSNYFYAVCSQIADGIKSAKNAVQYITQMNYDIVATVLSILRYVGETMLMVMEQGLYYFRGFIGYVTDLFNTISSFVDSLLSCSHKIISGIHDSALDLYTSINNVIFAFTSSVCDGAFAIKSSMVDICESVASVVSWSVSSCFSVAMVIVMFLANVGRFCVNFVTAVWQGLGYILSSIAYFPVYCFECVESVKNRAIENIVHAFTAMPKESYLGIICLCLLYFTLSNAARYISCHGLKLFSSRLRSRRRQPSYEWQLDRDFESDFEDMYGSDADDNVWMIPGLRDRNDRGSENDGSEDDDEDRSGSSDSGTVDEDNDVSDVDDDNDDETEGSEDGYTVISDDSDSDSSLISQTLSTESSEHEIEVSLPTVDDRYSLRSRSSTPSSTASKNFESPEDFNREMERERDKRKCVVCQDQIKSVLVMPCRHMCLCVLCADQIVRSNTVTRRVCPLCRTKIQKVMNIYV